jgi:hypothetical protein
MLILIVLLVGLATDALFSSLVVTLLKSLSRLLPIGDMSVAALGFDPEDSMERAHV